MPRPSIGRDLLDVPMGEMIREMAFAIADAQIKLDSNSIEVAQMMGGLKTITSTVNGEERVTFEDSRVFFGKEKMMLSTSIELYNSTTDQAQKAAIKQNAIDANPGDVLQAYDKPVVVVDIAIPGTAGATYAPADKKDKEGHYYKSGTDFYTYASGTSSYTKLVSPNLPAPTGAYQLNPSKADKFVYIPSRVSMLELGFNPNFYQFVDTIIEVKISISFKEERSTEVNIKSDGKTTTNTFRFGKGEAQLSRTISTTQVNATYAQKYSYSAEGSSLLRTKLTPVPPPSILEERIRQQMEIARENK